MHALICLALVAAPAVPTATGAAGIPLTSRTTEFGGERLTVSFFPPAEADGPALVEAAVGRITRVLALLSDDDPGSELSRINRGAGKGPVSVSPETAVLLTRAQTLAMTTGGTLRLTAESLTRAWDFRTSPRQADLERLKERLALADDRKLSVDTAANTATLADANVSVSLGRLRAALAVDDAVALLQERGVTQALVMVGTAVRTLGTKADKPWWVGIQDPRAVGYFAAVTLQDQAIATDGDYFRFLVRDGVRLCDLLDLHSGSLTAQYRSATALAPDAATAYVLARHLAIRGLEATQPLLAGLPNAGAVVVDRDNAVAVSPGLNQRLRVVRPPTQ